MSELPLKSIPISRRLLGYWPILAYHSVSDVRSDGLSISTAEFESHLRSLKESGFESAAPSELLGRLEATPPGPELPSQHRKVVITFDDGYRDNYEKAFPLLRKYGYTATFFVVTSLTGTDRMIESDLVKPSQGLGPESSFAFMNWEEVADLQANGMQIGSHTCTHTVFDPPLPYSVLEEEIVRSKDVLESRLNRRVDSFCYPRGKLDARAHEILARADYRAAVVTPNLKDGIIETQYTMKRVGLYRSNLMKFRFKISPTFFRLRSHGAFRWV